MSRLWPYLTSFAVAAGLLTLLSCQPLPPPTHEVDPKWALVRYLGSIHQLPGEHMITVRVRRYDAIWDAIEKARKRHSYAVRRIYREAGQWCADVAIFESITND